MGGRLFGVLMLSGLCSCAASSLHPRQFHFINQLKAWPEAQGYCRDQHTDLATVTNEKDLKELVRLTAPDSQFVFLGLYRTWTWSQSDADDYREGEPAYWNWESGQPVREFCGSITYTGEWAAQDCSNNRNFFCYNALAIDPPQRFTLGVGSLNWHDAQAYCRKHHTDLARVRNQLENEELQRAVSGPVWIGLTGKSWAWSDGTEPSFLPWRPDEPEDYGVADYAVLDVKAVGMVDMPLDTVAPFYCYSGPTRKHVVSLKLTADGSSVDMKDPAVMESILKWVRQNLRDEGVSEDVKLSWWKLP